MDNYHWPIRLTATAVVSWTGWASSFFLAAKPILELAVLLLSFFVSFAALISWQHSTKARKLEQCRFLLEAICITCNHSPKECPYTAANRPEHCILRQRKADIESAEVTPETPV